MTVEIRDERFRDVVGDDADVERLATGFEFTEGAMWDPRGKCLIFSDMPGNIMRKWSADNGVETYRQPSNMANGNFWDRQGRLLTCEHATSRLVRQDLDGSMTSLASHYGDKELNSPNDVVVRSDGTIFFSDPIFGRVEYYGNPRAQQLDFQGVYRLDPDGAGPYLLVSDFDQPNGLSLSQDESKLYINDTPNFHIREFDVAANGSLSGGDVWADVAGDGEGNTDGLTFDSAGNLFTTGPAGIHIFAPDATSLGIIHVPEGAANFTWGDDDLQTLYITASTSLYTTRVKVPGRTLI